MLEITAEITVNSIGSLSTVLKITFQGNIKNISLSLRPHQSEDKVVSY